uniref:Uncharacterized protein n=1 Tax=Ciona savignyi TaxID=51511 RepID=H2Y528_CIOSA
SKGIPPIHEQPDIINDITRRNGTNINFGRNVEKIVARKDVLGTSPPLNPTIKPHPIDPRYADPAGYETPPPGYESPDDLSTVGYKVDLKTLKEHVRKRGRGAPVKPQKENYALAHHVVNC